jgi:F0F1-type ATP synthase assembly protein I
MLGFFLDRALSTFPLFLLIGVFLGFGGSLVQIYRLAMRELKG